MKTWRIAVIGAAGFARAKHIPAYKAMENVELVACCDINPEALARTGDEFDIPGRYTDLGAMLAAERPEIVAVVVPPPWHVPLARRCVEAGCHVLVEKPLSEEYAEMLAFRDFLAGRHEKVMVSQNYRFQNPALAMRDALAGGLLGAPYWLELSIYNPSGERPREHRNYKSLFVNIGVHLVDLARLYAGSPTQPPAPAAAGEGGWGVKARDVEAVYAPPVRAPHAPGLRYPFTEIQVFFSGGLTAHVRMDWSSRGLAEWIKTRVQGTEGVAVCDYGVSPDVLLARPGEPERRFHRDDHPDSLPRVMNHLIDCITHDRQPETCVADNIQTMEIILAAYLSCRENRVMRFPEVRERLGEV